MVSSKEAVRIIVEEMNRVQNQGGDGGARNSAEVDEDVHSSKREQEERS